MRNFSSSAALSVNVNATIFAGSAKPSATRKALLVEINSVLPAPAQAMIWRFPRVRCGSDLRVVSKLSVLMMLSQSLTYFIRGTPKGNQGIWESLIEREVIQTRNQRCSEVSKIIAAIPVLNAENINNL